MCWVKCVCVLISSEWTPVINLECFNLIMDAETSSWWCLWWTRLDVLYINNLLRQCSTVTLRNSELRGLFFYSLCNRCRWPSNNKITFQLGNFDQHSFCVWRCNVYLLAGNKQRFGTEWTAQQVTTRANPPWPIRLREEKDTDVQAHRFTLAIKEWYWIIIENVLTCNQQY